MADQLPEIWQIYAANHREFWSQVSFSCGHKG
jgi:hypothetical protein